VNDEQRGQDMNAPQRIEGTTTVPTGAVTQAVAIVEHNAFDPLTPDIAASQVDVGQLLMAAIQSGTPVKQMEKLCDLYERLEDRNAKAAWNKAMSAFKAECPRIVKRMANEQFQGTVTRDGLRKPRRYADLEDIASVIDPILPRHGLSYRWGDDAIDGEFVRLACIVSHVDGHAESSSVLMPRESKAGASAQQKLASATTYAKRLSLVKAFGLTAFDDDDDGAATAEAEKQPTITQEQFMAICDLLDSTGRTVEDRKRMKTLYKIEEISQLPASKYEEVIAILSKPKPEPGATA